MRNIGDKLLPRLVQSVHAAKNSIEGVRDVHSLCVLRRGNGLVGISLLDFKDVYGQLFKRTHEHTGKKDGRKKDNDQHDQLQHKSLSSQDFLGLLDIFRRSAGKQYASYCIGLVIPVVLDSLYGITAFIFFGSAVPAVYNIVQALHGFGLDDRDDNFDESVFSVVIFRSIALSCHKTGNDILGDDRLVLRQPVSVLDNRQRRVDDHESSIVQGREFGELRVDLSGLGVDQIVAVDQVVGQGSELPFYLLHTHFDSTLLIVSKDTVL